MRSNIDEIKIGKYTFKMELDTGGASDEEYVCWIYKNDEPLINGNGLQVRKYFSTFNKKHFINFCNKFSCDENYQNEIMVKNV